jgi:hypothetical protein
MVNKPRDINKTNIDLSPQLINYNTDHDIYQFKSRTLVRTDTNICCKYIRLIGCLRDNQHITLYHKNYQYKGGYFKINA